MGVPQNKVSKARRDQRRSHHALSRPTHINCPNCGETKRPHYACPHCGTYKGREAVKVVEKKQ